MVWPSQARRRQSPIGSPARFVVSLWPPPYPAPHRVLGRRKRCRYCEAKRFGGLEIDQELELWRLFDRDFAGFGRRRTVGMSSRMISIRFAARSAWPRQARDEARAHWVRGDREDDGDRRSRMH